MPSTSRTTSASAIRLLFLLAILAITVRSQAPMEQGCFASSEPLTQQGTDRYQSSGNCIPICTGLNKPVMGLSNANTCWCGDLFPAQSDQVSDSECDTPCNGYPDESCGGGSSYLTVWLTGLEADVGYFGGGSSGGDEGSGGDESSTVTSEPSPPPTSPTSSPTKMQTTPRPNRPRPTPSVVTSVAPGTTIVITNTPVPSSPASSTPTLKSSSGGGGSNVAGIAAGVVVGVVAVIAIATGIFFFIRHKRRKEAEEEYKRTQVSDFMRGGDKRPPPTGYSNMSDSRLDPEAGNRRDSHGSIADDQDFSRRILRVANPDTSGR